MGGIARDGARYRIGPLTTYARPDQLREWHKHASPGDRCIYAIGPALGADPVAALAREMGEAGTVHLSRERDERGWRYFMEKRPSPPAQAAKLCLGGLERQLLEALVQIADEGLPLPSFEILAERAGLSDRHAARYRLQNLEAQGHVRITCLSSGARVAEIVATGQRTAEIVKQQRA